MDTIRVFRILEYIGPRDVVERTVAMSIHGEKIAGDMVIKAATLGVYPEIMDKDALLETR